MAHFCDHCERSFTNPRCPRCGGPPSTQAAADNHVDKPVPLSDQDDTLDDMIEQASIPTLASLLQRGVEKGLIKPVQDYANGIKS